jgi:hypothetical protein
MSPRKKILAQDAAEQQPNKEPIIAQAPIQLIEPTEQEKILAAITHLLDERDKALPSLIRNEVQKMVNEAKQGALQPQQQPQAPQQPQVEGELPRYQPPQQIPEQQPPQGGGMMGGLANALPAIMQMIGGGGGAGDFQKMFVDRVFASALDDMTFNRDFSRAFMQSVLKNVGGEMANRAVKVVNPEGAAP